MVHVDVEYSETITEQGTSLFTPISGEPKNIRFAQNKKSWYKRVTTHF